MKKFVLFLIWAVINIGFLSLLNCSRPLDIDRITQPSADTVFVPDTIIFNDTLYVDTLYTDTLYVDTLYVDTIYADTMPCARLNSHRQEIVWLLFNQEEFYRLEFLAATEQIRRSQILVIYIDEEQYYWDLSDSMSFTIERDLDELATIRITSQQPHAYGQAIDICLRVREP